MTAPAEEKKSSTSKAKVTRKTKEEKEADHLSFMSDVMDQEKIDHELQKLILLGRTALPNDEVVTDNLIRHAPELSTVAYAATHNEPLFMVTQPLFSQLIPEYPKSFGEITDLQMLYRIIHNTLMHFSGDIIRQGKSFTEQADYGRNLIHKYLTLFPYFLGEAVVRGVVRDMTDIESRDFIPMATPASDLYDKGIENASYPGLVKVPSADVYAIHAYFARRMDFHVRKSA